MNIEQCDLCQRQGMQKYTWAGVLPELQAGQASARKYICCDPVQSTMEGVCFLNQLPDELLIRIFSYLPTPDLVNLHRIENRRIKNLLLDATLTRCLNFSGCHGLEDSALLGCLRSFSSSERLSLAGCYQLKLAPVFRVVSRFKDLLVLDLTNVGVTVAALANLLDNLPSLEALGITATETVPLDSRCRPERPFRKSTISALARLKHFKYVLGHRCIRKSILPCVKNVQSLVLDFMPFEYVHDHCSCCFSVSTTYLSVGVGNLRAVFAPRSVLNQVTSHMFLSSVQTYLRSGFVPYTRSCNEVICLRLKHSSGSIKDGAVACDLEPSWTAYVRKDALDKTAHIASPFIRADHGDTWRTLSSVSVTPVVGKSQGVKFLKICCFPDNVSHCSKEVCAILEKVHGNPTLDVLEIVVGQGRDCFLPRYDSGSNPINRYNVSHGNSPGARNYFNDIIRIIEESPRLRKVSVTASRNTGMLKSFLVDLSVTCKRLQSFSIEFPRSYLNLQLSAHLNLVLPTIEQLCDLRIDSSYFQLNAQFLQSISTCLRLRRICILTRGGKCSVCQKLPFLFDGCPGLMFLCLDGFTHEPCSHKQANAMVAAIKKRYGSARPGLVVSHSWRSQPGIPDVHFAEMVANRGRPR